MKKLVLLSAALLLVFSIIAGCSGGTDEKMGKVHLKTFNTAWPNTLDPSRGSDLYGTIVLQNILEPLVRWDAEEGRLVPAGAETWTISSDGLIYTFKLRDMIWTDDKPVTSADYAYGIRRTADPETASLVTNFIYPLKNGFDVASGKKPVSELGVSTPDEKTLVLELASPLPYFMEMVTYRAFYPQREDWVEKYADTYATTPSTSPMCGPFVLLDDWVINSSKNYEKNAKFWNAANVKLERVEYKVIQDPVAIYSALLSGEIDAASVADAEWREKFENNSDFIKSKAIRPDIVYMLINCSDPLLKNKKIRQALSAALDREDLIKAARKGVGLPAYWFSPPTVFLQGQKFNEVGAGPVKDLIDKNQDLKALFIEGLKELGLDPDPSKHTIEFLSSGTSQDSRTEGEYYQQTWKDKIGVNTTVTLSEWGEFRNRLDAQNYQLAALGWNADFNDPSNFLETAWPESKTYQTGWNNDEFNECIVKAQSEQDPKKRFELLKRAEVILIAEEAAVIPLTTRETNSFRRSFVKNLSIDQLDSMGWQKIDTSERK
ncbi:peptide ABC transporter substrate-binding protein [Treponema pedis]|uniref:Oligopeptide ABC transporter substrate-bindingprotein n=1 Tax=Treponema pedis str. T A4 TaxID=1291379 RepID=S6A4N0_9SPIR|nr:peptide ABC transporter substrate-binding protein [Treponema pedis]AGT44566.1 oligopeptide ABC transporter substrate-bindingprotein [Treponema pedis str. T A4]